MSRSSHHCRFRPLTRMGVLVLLALFSVAMGLVYLLTRPRNLPPGPFYLPLLGSVGQYRQIRKRRLDFYFMELSKKYGPVIQIRILSTITVILNGYDAIHQAYVKQADVFSDRPHWLPGMEEALKHGNGLMWQSGKHWKRMRSLTSQALRDFGVGKTSLEEKIMLEVDDVSRVLSDGEPTDIRNLMSMAIANVIHGITSGSRFEYTDSVLRQLIDNLEVMFSGSGNISITPISYIPAAIRNHLPLKAARDLIKRHNAIRWVEEHFFTQIDQHRQSYNHGDVRDFIDLYIQITSGDQKYSKEDGFTDGNLFCTIMDLFIGGSETTFNTLNWSFLYMLEYPDVQKRCQAELDEVVGHRHVSLSDRSQLPFIEATLLEIQRISNIVPGTIPHTTNVDTTLLGYFIPKGTILVANLTSSNMDLKYWDEPEMFRPERFLTNAGEIVRNDALVPFSIGPRKCLGDSLAKMEMFLIFTNLLQRFTFQKEAADMKLDFTPRIGQMLTNAAVDYKAVAKSRT